MRALVLGFSCALLASTVQAQDAPICTDRPTKANAVCTVPAGQWQIESAAVDWLRLDQGDSETETLLLGASLLKVGLSSRSDLQLGFTPFVRVTTNGDHRSGVGDVTFRYKHRLSATNAPVQVAIIPFVKLPTAKTGIGNKMAEGGVALPVSFALGAATLTIGPEADWLVDADGHGRHLGTVQLVNLAAAVAPRLTLAGEFWSSWNFDPDGTVWQSSADVAVAYAATANVQLDVGANIGLSRNTPDVQLYAGVSKRF